MAKHDAYPDMQFATPAKFEAWLKKSYDSVEGIWLVLAKKGAGEKTVAYAEAVEVALCWGWIDGQTRTLDEHYYRVKFTPRGARSKWSQINVGRVEALTATGRMQPPGLAEVERAKADGRWAAAYAPPSTAEVPEDFAIALAKNKRASATFETVSKSNRFAIIYRVNDAKRPETRARRIKKFVEMLERGERLY